jgi:hypothetical protein
MRPGDYLKAIGIALGFITSTQTSSLATTYFPSNIGGPDAGRRDDDHYMMRLRDDHHDRSESINAQAASSASETHLQKKSIEAAMVSSLLDGSRHASDEGDLNSIAVTKGEGNQLDADPGSARVSATPLPAALPLFAGGMGVLGFLARRRKTGVTCSRRG